MKPNIRRLFILGGLAGAVGLDSTALAVDDGKDYPGALCQTRNAGTAFSREGNGRMANPGTVFLSLFCPGVHDLDNTIDGVDVTVIDRNASTNVSCTFYSRSRDGDFLGFRTDVSSGSSTTPQVLEFAGSGIPSEAHAYMFFNCALPAAVGTAQSMIVSYGIDE
jgi:hypothetical protein